MQPVVMGVGWQYITLMSALILILGAAVGKLYHEKLLYKKLFLNQKGINRFNYEYWFDFFTRNGILKETQGGPDGERIWVLLTDPIQSHRNEVSVAVFDWIDGLISYEWGDEDAHDE